MGKSFPDDYTAVDIMTKHVVTVNPDQTLREVMDVLVDGHISGAPVVDATNHCVGLVSASDILGFEEEQRGELELTEDEEGVGRFFDAESQRWESVRLSAFAFEELAEVDVQQVMSAAVVGVRPETPIREVAEVLVEKGIHRVVVTDASGLLLGIVSATDFLRTMVRG